MRELAGLANENFMNMDERYNIKCEVELNYFGTEYKGQDIESLTAPKINVSFLMGMEVKSWGIQAINIYDVKGPSEIELDLEYYTDESEDPVREEVVIPIDWGKVQMEENEELKHIGISNYIEFEIDNDNDGNLVISKINVTYKGV